MAKRAKLADPVGIKGVLSQVFKNLEIDGKMDDFKIMQAWDGFLTTATKPLLAKKLKEYTFAHRVTRERSLVIGVRSAVMANELQFMKPMLQKKFIELVVELELPVIAEIAFELRS
ncbi:MAG: hypothetical protein HOA17_06540 [Candidatus Melainabacteria bacterium]|jgi:hypothetical protein|nr:hypothetical protein [Candidatus Melainabacteria bacterium]